MGDESILDGYRLYAVTVGLCFGALMMSLDISIIRTVGPQTRNPSAICKLIAHSRRQAALPSVMSGFGGSTNMAWYPAAFTLATCSLTPVAGKVAAVFPLDVVYSSFTLVFLAGSIVCGWAPSSGAFIAGHAIAGIEAAGVLDMMNTVKLTGKGLRSGSWI